MSQPTTHQLLGQLTAKVDTVLDGQREIKIEVDEIKGAMENLRAEDKRIDNRVTMTVAVSKAYIAGIASVFTAVGATVTVLGQYIFGKGV